MKKITKILGLLVLACCLQNLSCTSNSPTDTENKGDLEGNVYERNTNVPISGVLVKAVDFSSTTNSDGYYNIQGVPVGQVTVTATKPDYENYEQTVTINRNRTTELDIYILSFR